MSGEDQREVHDRRMQGELSSVTSELKQLQERVSALDRLMEAKFVTFDVMVTSQAEKVALALTAADKAVNKAEIATEKRFENMNEFRGQLADQASTLVSRTEFAAKADALGEKLTDITDRINRTEGKGTGLSAGWGFLVGGAGLIFTIISIAALILKFTGGP